MNGLGDTWRGPYEVGQESRNGHKTGGVLDKRHGRRRRSCPHARSAEANELRVKGQSTHEATARRPPKKTKNNCPENE